MCSERCVYPYLYSEGKCQRQGHEKKKMMRVIQNCNAITGKVETGDQLFKVMFGFTGGSGSGWAAPGYVSKTNKTPAPSRPKKNNLQCQKEKSPSSTEKGSSERLLSGAAILVVKDQTSSQTQLKHLSL